MISALKKVPEELRRFAAVGVVAGIVATAVIYSRGEHVVLGDAWLGSKQAFQQPKDRQQEQAWFTPAPRLDMAEVKSQVGGWITPTPGPGLAEVKPAEIANTFTLAQSRTSRPGFYYELVRAQGDGEGEYVLIERKCVPKVDMPDPCYLPEQGRRNFPLRRE
jgi:hypothetical protein